MKVIGLTGGIGSGKTSVGALLVERGAVLIDGDSIARELQAPGQPVLAAMVARFGALILHDDGTLNRPAVAALVFHDKEALEALNKIVHPALLVEYAARTAAAVAAHPNAVVVHDIPLLKERREGLHGVIVVDVPVDVAVHRLMTFRGFSEVDARARIANQITREERCALADIVIDNSSTPSHLEAEVNRAWAWIEALEIPAGVPVAPATADPAAPTAAALTNETVTPSV